MKITSGEVGVILSGIATIVVAIVLIFQFGILNNEFQLIKNESEITNRPWIGIYTKRIVFH